MAHLRTRYLQIKYEELVRFAPLIGVLGHRQVGKTTFLESNARTYLTFDDEDTLKKAIKSPKQFIKLLTKPHTALDESQLVAGIFPALKERVRVNKKPGQFILSGSVRFTSKASIRESLTGRIQYLELLPMTISELLNQNIPNTLKKIFTTQHIPALIDQLTLLTRTQQRNEKEVENYRIKGGLPGLCFIRKDQTRNDKILDQLKTILDRDLRQIYPTQLPFDTLKNFLSELAINESKPYQYQNYKRILGLSPITQKKLLYALEAVFLIRRIPIEGDHRGFSIVFEDQAESYYLAKHKQTIEQQLINLLYRNLRAEYFYQVDWPVETFQFITQNNKTVPLVFRTHEACIGFLYSDSDHISRDLKGTASSFLKRYANSKIIYVSSGKILKQIDGRSILCPISNLI